MTRDTAPFTIWSHELWQELVVSCKLVIDVGDLSQFRPRISAAYQAGEPLWMVAHEIALRINSAARERKAADDGRTAIRAAIRASRK